MSVRFDREETSQLLVAAVDALDLPMLLHDQDLVLFANSAAAKVLGAVSGADIAGLSLDSFLDPELASMARERRAYLLRNQVIFDDLPIKMRTLDGRTVHLRVDARPISFHDSTIGMVTLRR
jgi:PAS domain-containing protein